VKRRAASLTASSTAPSSILGRVARTVVSTTPDGEEAKNWSRRNYWPVTISHIASFRSEPCLWLRLLRLLTCRGALIL
jgi:hypothetical protein